MTLPGTVANESDFVIDSIGTAGRAVRSKLYRRDECTSNKGQYGIVQDVRTRPTSCGRFAG